MDLKGNPEPLRLLSFEDSSHLWLAMIWPLPRKSARFTGTQDVKVLCNDQTFMETINLLEIELASRAHDDEEKEAEECQSGNGCFYPEGLWKG